MSYKGLLAAGAAIFALAAHAAPPQFKVIETGVDYRPSALNNLGEIAFWGVSGFGIDPQAALWSNGTLSSPRTNYTLPPGISWAIFGGASINDDGIMVGSFSQGGLAGRSDGSFRWDSRNGDVLIYEPLVPPDGNPYNQDRARDINNAGVVAGVSSFENSYGHVRDGTEIRWLTDGRPEAAIIDVVGINEGNTVVGFGVDEAESPVGIVWMADGTRHFIGPLGVNSEGYGFIWAAGINDADIALFNSETGFDYEQMPLLWTGGTTTPLGFFAPDYRYTSGTGLNNAGQVVGSAYKPSGGSQLNFLWQDGTYWNLQDLLAPEFSDWTIGGSGQVLINNLGQVAAWGCRPGSGCQTLLLDPIRLIDPPPPGGTVLEPATWAMLIAGFGLVGAAMRRRQNPRLVIA